MNLILLHYPITLSLFFFQLSAASKSSFYPIPISPRPGEKVFLFCELEADESKFSSIVPDLIIDTVGTYQFHFNDISSELGDRYYGFDIPDLNRVRLRGFIFISSLNESDLSINFTCRQTLLQNDEVISASLILNKVHITQNTFNPTRTLISHIMSSTMNPNPSSEVGEPSLEATATPEIYDTPIQTTSTLMNPIPTTKQVDGFGIPKFEIVMGTIATICLILIVILGIVICIAYLIRYFKKNRNDDVATEYNPVQPQSISNIPSGSESSVCTTSFKSCDDTQSFKSCDDTQSFESSLSIPGQDNSSSEESYHTVRLNSIGTQSDPEENI